MKKPGIIGRLLATESAAAVLALIVVFVIFCFRAIFRKDWIASVAAAVLFTLVERDTWQGNMLLLNFLFFVFRYCIWLFSV